jgi:hypothetical protein
MIDGPVGVRKSWVRSERPETEAAVRLLCVAPHGPEPGRSPSQLPVEPCHPMTASVHSWRSYSLGQQQRSKSSRFVEIPLPVLVVNGERFECFAPHCG